MSSWPHVFGTQYPSVNLSWLDDQFNQVSGTATATISAAGANLVGYTWGGVSVAGTVAAKLNQVVSVKDPPFNAKGDGTTDDSAAIQAAIDALKAAKGGVLVIPPGNYYIGTTINLANLSSICISVVGAGRGDGLYDSAPTTGSNFYGRTGTQAVIEAQGTEHLSLRDFGIYTLSGDTDRSCIGIFIGRTTVYGFAEFHDYRRLNIVLTSNATANSSRGTICIYNQSGEHGTFDSLRLRSDTPYVPADNNALSYTPTYGTLVTVNSCTLNSMRECAFLSQTSSLRSVEGWGIASSSFIDCFYGNDNGVVNGSIAVVLRAGAAVPGNVKFLNGQIENWDCFLQMPDGSENIEVDLEYAGPTAAGPMVGLASGKTYSNLRVHFGNNHSIAVPAVGALSATATMYGGRIVLEQGNNLNSSGLLLLGTEVVDANSSAATVSLASGSRYMRSNASSIPFFSVGGFAQSLSTPTYSASITPDASLGNHFEITVTDANAFTVNVPTNTGTGNNGQLIGFSIVNSSGGAMGAVTFAAGYRTTGAFTSPASTKVRTIMFWFDGTNWLEVSRSVGDM